MLKGLKTNQPNQQQQHKFEVQQATFSFASPAILSAPNPQKSSASDLFTTEFEINDVRISARNILTKGQTHDEIAQFSGASISTRGRYISHAEKSRGFVHSRPLYLFLQGSTQQSVALAVQKINEIIANDQQQQQPISKTPGNHSIVNRMTKFNSRPPPIMVQQNQQQNSTFVEKMMVGLENAPPAFNLREQVIGAGGANLHYIRNETGAVATLRGRGSLFIDPNLGTESHEPLHLYIEHPRYEGLQAAKQLAKNLIETLQQELVHFQQLSQNTQNVSYSTSAGTIIQQGQPIAQINVPPPILAVPPPLVQQNPIETQTNQATIVQQNFMQQNPPPTLGGPPQTVQSQPQTIIHQQIIPQTVPIQLQQGNMLIQQNVQQPPTIGNVNIPPPGIPIPIKTGQIVQFQGPPPPTPATAHLTQPPPNVQLQHQQQPTTAQIVLNHPQNYQYQYIQQPVQTTDPQMQANQLTIQHIYQPQQQIQGIVQQAPPTSQPQTFEQFQQVRSLQATQQPQQYITVQGSTAYMVPPPTIIHHATSQPNQVQTQITTSNPNIIFHPPPHLQQQIQQVQMQMAPGISIQNVPPPPSTNMGATQDASNQANSNDDGQGGDSIKDESKNGSESGDSPSQKSPDIKREMKTEGDGQSSDSNGDVANQNQTLQATNSGNTVAVSIALPTQEQHTLTLRHPPPLPPPHQQLATSITLPATQVPPPIMAVPPPMSCVQHFVGNTLITTHPPAQTHTNQIYNQAPVSIQQITPTGQQIQHFVVNAAPQQWQNGPPPQQIQQQSPIQQIQPNGTIQNVQITHHQIVSAQAPTDFRAIPPPGTTIAGAQHQTATTAQTPIMATFNPHVQVQFQPQMLQQMPPSQTIESAQIISNQLTHTHPHQHFSVVQSQQVGVAPTYQQTVLPPPQFQSQIKQNSFQEQQQFRPGQKRKHDDDDTVPHNYPPRMGMGPTREQIQQQQHHLLQQPPPPPPPVNASGQQGNNSMNSGNSGGTGNNGPTNSNSTNNAQDENNGQKSQSDGQQQMQQIHGPPPLPPSGNFYQDNRPFYQRDVHNESSSFMEGPSSRQFESGSGGLNNNSGTGMGGNGPMMPAMHGPRGPRFHHNNGPPMGGGQGFPMRPPMHMQEGNFQMHRMNLGPPPPPPPPYRGDCPPNMNGGYGPPPPPRFRGQW